MTRVRLIIITHEVVLVCMLRSPEEKYSCKCTFCQIHCCIRFHCDIFVEEVTTFP
jgi:hypothetical protein